jgi:hypothetical protein
VDQAIQCAPEALGPTWLIGNRLRPSGLVWSSEDTLCGGHGDPPSFVEKLLSGGNIKVTKGVWRAFVPSQVVLLGETW